MLSILDEDVSCKLLLERRDATYFTFTDNAAQAAQRFPTIHEDDEV